MSNAPAGPSKRCTLLVLSCDPYADLWPPFFALLNKHWPDCPFDVFLGAGNEATTAPAGVHLLRSDGGRDWSKCAADYLRSLSQPYVLVMLDDFFLRSRVANGEILRCLDFAQARQAIQVRLIPRPRPTHRLPGEPNIGSCAPASSYRLSTQAAIWDRTKLLSLLVPGESIWEFEVNGNLRANALPDGFFSVRRAVLPYDGRLAHHVVEKGKWLPHEKWIFGRQNIGCDFSRRATLSFGQTLMYHAVQFLVWTLNLLPAGVSRHLKNSLKRILQPMFKTQFVRLRGFPPRS